MTGSEKKQVSSAEFIRNFSKYRAVSTKFPVFITSYGRPTHVLIDIDQFEAGAYSASDLSDEVYANVLMEFSAMSYDAMLVCDANETVLHANAIAGSMLRTSKSALAGQRLSEVLPNYPNSMIEASIRQTIEANEITSLELPSPFRKGSWVLFRSYPWHSVNLLVFRDITESVRAHRFADVKAAILKAMELHGEIYYVRLDANGAINRADAPFCDLVGIPERRLLGANFSDLAAPSCKVALKDQVKEVLSGADQAQFATEFVDNRGTVHELRGSLVALHGGYVLEGAVAMMTRADA